MRTLLRWLLASLLAPLVIAVPVMAVLGPDHEPPGCVVDGPELAAKAVPAIYADAVHDAATAHGVPARWLAAVITAESAWRPDAHSPVGAMGLGQLMPATAAELGVTDPWDPRQSIDGAARYLAAQHGTFGDWDLAVAAYNAGPGAVRRHGGVPPYDETQAYVPKVRALAERFAATDGATAATDCAV